MEENPLLTLLQSKIIIKNDKEKVSIALSQISNVRVIKHRDPAVAVLVLVFLALFYILVLSPVNLILTLSLLFLTLISILLIVSFSIKIDTYKLLINQAEFGFKQIYIKK